MSLLKEYIKYGVWPLKREDGTYENQKKHHRGRKQNLQERVSEYIGPYHISGDHHVCYLDTKLVQDHLQCAYTHIDAMANIKQTRSKSGKAHVTDKERYPVKKALLSADRPTGIHRKTDKTAEPVKEVFVVRDPLKRLVSIYYFWGELYRIRTLQKEGKVDRKKVHLGQAHETDTSGDAFMGTLFTYHGNETTVPPDDIAHEFARASSSTACQGPL